MKTTVQSDTGIGFCTLLNTPLLSLCLIRKESIVSNEQSLTFVLSLYSEGGRTPRAQVTVHGPGYDQAPPPFTCEIQATAAQSASQAVAAAKKLEAHARPQNVRANFARKRDFGFPLRRITSLPVGFKNHSACTKVVSCQTTFNIVTSRHPRLQVQWLSSTLRLLVSFEKTYKYF